MYTLKYYIHHLHYEHTYPFLHNTFWFPWINISILNMYTYVYIDELYFIYIAINCFMMYSFIT